jgi:hypothetical protein
MAGVNLGHVQVFLQQGMPSPKGCSVYFVIGDADESVAGEATVASFNALYEFQRANGVEVLVPPGDRLYGLRDYTVRDLYGYALTFGYRLAGAAVDPLKIERVDVPVLAANAINAGHPLATTYGSIDTSLPKIAWHELAQAFAFYFVEQKESAATIVLALLAAGGVLAARKRLRFSGAGPAAAMAMIERVS